MESQESKPMQNRNSTVSILRDDRTSSCEGFQKRGTEKIIPVKAQLVFTLLVAYFTILSMGKALETVSRFYEITENKKGKGLEDVIAKDMTFDGPLMKFKGAKEYIDSTKQFLQMHRATRMQKQFENGNDVCSIYEMDVATPSGE